MEDAVSIVDDFDPAQYARLPRFDVVAGIALARQLVSTLEALTSEEAQPLRRGAARLRQEADALQQVWLLQQSSGVSVEPAPVDQMADTAWRLLHERLLAYASLPSDLHPEAVRAAEILSTVFPDGLAFLALDYASQLREADDRLQRIATRGFAGDIHRLAGTAFLVEVERCHQLYRRALGAHEQDASGQPALTPISQPLRSMTQALLALCAQLVSLYFEGDGQQRKLARFALRPVDEFRAAVLQKARAVKPPGGGTDSGSPAS